MNGAFIFSIDKPLIIKKEGPKGPFSTAMFYLLTKRLIASQSK
jgi:hypothetical protein